MSNPAQPGPPTMEGLLEKQNNLLQQLAQMLSRKNSGGISFAVTAIGGGLWLILTVCVLIYVIFWWKPAPATAPIANQTTVNTDAPTRAEVKAGNEAVLKAAKDEMTAVENRLNTRINTVVTDINTALQNIRFNKGWMPEILTEIERASAARAAQQGPPAPAASSTSTPAAPSAAQQIDYRVNLLCYDPSGRVIQAIARDIKITDINMEAGTFLKDGKPNYWPGKLVTSYPYAMGQQPIIGYIIQPDGSRITNVPASSVYANNGTLLYDDARGHFVPVPAGSAFFTSELQ